MIEEKNLKNYLKKEILLKRGIFLCLHF